MKSFALLLAALIPAAATAQAPVRPATAPMPAAVRAKIVEMGKICRDVGGRPGKSPDLVKTADLTGDGIADHVLQQGAFNCEGAASAMENGQSGSDVFVFASGPGNMATLAYSASVYSSEIQGQGARARLYLGVSGQLCGQRVAKSFADQDFCLRPLNWVPARRMFVMAPMSEKRSLSQ